MVRFPVTLLHLTVGQNAHTIFGSSKSILKLHMKMDHALLHNPKPIPGYPGTDKIFVFSGTRYCGPGFGNRLQLYPMWTSKMPPLLGKHTVTTLMQPPPDCIPNNRYTEKPSRTHLNFLFGPVRPLVSLSCAIQVQGSYPSSKTY